MTLQRCALILTILLIVGLAIVPASGQEAYCSITKVTTTALSNGATITVEADGMLQYAVQTGRRSEVTEITINLANARSALEDDLIRPENVHPISYISFTTAPNAPNGVGLLMRIVLVDASQFSIPQQTDPRKLVINIRTERTVPQARTAAAGEGEQAAGAEGDEGTIEVVYEDGLLTVRAIKADLHRVVAEIARQAGVNVAVDDRVKREVSMHVTGLTADQVLQGIASGYGLAISTVGDVKMLSEGIPTDLPTYGRSATQSYPLTYLKVDDAASLLPPFLIEYLRRNPQQNSIVVTAPRQMLEKIGRDLNAIDIAPPLIMVEVLAIEITGEGAAESFLEWQHWADDWETSGNTQTGELRYAEGESYGLSGGVVDTETLSARVRALLTTGRARIYSQPRMAAMNGERASIFIGRDRFIRMTYVRYGNEQERIETVRVGVSLSIVPWTGGNGEITSDVTCEVSNIVELDPETGIPRLSTRRAQATIRARDGETIVIGGLVQRQTETVHRRIPILSWLPIIGHLFESTRTRSTNSELVFFVTPRVIDPDTAAALAAEAAARAEEAFGTPTPAASEQP